MSKGWYREPNRHSLAAYGVETTTKHPARAVGESDVLARYSDDDAQDVVDILLKVDEIRPKFPKWYDVQLIKFWRGGTIEVVVPGDTYIFNVDEKTFNKILERVNDLNM